MDNTTIAIRRDLKEKIMEFATKKESYSDVIERLLKSAEQRLLNDVLFNEEGFISLDDFEKEVKRKWPKSK
ncbi:MAG: antitoxin VapB family protein [Nanoarchaeota archaeon]